MAKIFYHFKDERGSWVNDVVLCDRIPTIGEHIAISSSSPLYKVWAVIHCLFADAQHDAEVYLEAGVSTVELLHNDLKL